MANAVIALGGLIGVGIAIPVLGSLLPTTDAASGVWSGLTPEQADALKKATNEPVKIAFSLNETDGYYGATESDQFVWGVKATDAQMQAARPELFAAGTKPAYPVVNLGFVVFSPICPHLGCKYVWIAPQKKFICPCHNSQFDSFGTHLAGPALRGLDPLPLRDYQGKVQITWIEYTENSPKMIVQKIG
ncbi:MAG: Rieske 2Fe-2S domain-containing protein [Candidatus Velthaea sp.]